jgi:riboflavin kinase / FMN adenylyltransferase
MLVGGQSTSHIQNLLMAYRAPVYDSFEQFRRQAGRLVEARPVVSVGSFDGVHLGHQYILNELVEWARREQAPAIVVTFRVHPREIMTGRDMPSLNSPEHKIRLLSKAGIDGILMLEFNDYIRNLSAGQFMRDCVHGQLNARGMLVGFNNRIGKDGEGTYEVLRQIGQEIGVGVRQSERIEVSGKAMSSTVIRQHVAAGDFLWARKLLGRAYSILGVVIHGNKRGRTLGFPTANIDLQGLAYPPAGVYGVRVKIGEQWHLGAANIGTRPTVDPDRETPLLEVHVLDYAGNLYGSELELVFLFRVRDEQRFAGLDELKAQLKHDIAEVRRHVNEEEFE